MGMLDSVVGIVRESAERVRSARGFEVHTKGSLENVVTTADLENETFLKERLTSLVPGSSFMGEEGDENPLLEEGYTWIVDPIDGTTNFARGIPECAVSVALFKDAEPYIGVVMNPFNGRLYSAERGKGATMDGVPIRVSDRPLEDCVLSTAWCSYDKRFSAGCFDVSRSLYPRINDIRRIGTAAIELSMLGQGAIDLYFEIRLSPWDHAAADVILTEAGGVCRGIEGPLDYERSCPVLAANNQWNMDILLETVEQAFGKRNPYRCGHAMFKSGQGDSVS